MTTYIAVRANTPHKISDDTCRFPCKSQYLWCRHTGSVLVSFLVCVRFSLLTSPTADIRGNKNNLFQPIAQRD